MGNTNEYGNHDAHEQGLQVGGHHNELADVACGSADRCGNEISKTYANENGDDGSNENVDFGFLGDELTGFGGNDSHNVNGERAACAAYCIGGEANGDKGKENHRRGSQRVTYRNRHCGADHCRGKTAYGVACSVNGCNGGGKKTDMQLTSKRVEDSTHQQGAEQTLCHSAQRVNAVSAAGNDYVFANEECLECSEELFHMTTSFLELIIEN